MHSYENGRLQKCLLRYLANMESNILLAIQTEK
jgi:hypothetical protein